MTVYRLRHLAVVNPSTPAFDRLGPDQELTFLPMEAVWPGPRLDISQRRPKAAVSTGYTRFQDGDVLVPKITPTFEAGRSVLIKGLCSGVGAGTTELHVLRAGSEIDPRFLIYLVNTHSFLKLGEAAMYGVAGQQRVPDSFLRDLEVDLPTLDEQRRIANLLDAETTRIDRSGEAMAIQIRLLTELRLRALDSAWPAVRTPVKRLGYGAQLVTSGSRGWADFVGDSGSVFFRSANLRRDNLRPNLSSLAYVELPPSTAVEASRSRIDDGDVLVGITGANTGWVTLADDSIKGGNVSQHVCLIRPFQTDLDGRWLAYLIASPTTQSGLMGSQYGGTKTQLSLSDIRDIRIPVTPIAAQRELAARVNELLDVVDKQRALRNRQLDVLAERRRALITAAVNGQIDVSTASGRGIED